jgi:hypothetical protein
MSHLPKKMVADFIVHFAPCRSLKRRKLGTDPAGDSGDGGATVATGRWRPRLPLAVGRPSRAGAESEFSEELKQNLLYRIFGLLPYFARSISFNSARFVNNSARYSARKIGLFSKFCVVFL